MTTDQQLALMRKTNLTSEEQWILLNTRDAYLEGATKAVDVYNNYTAYGLSKAQADEYASALVKIAVDRGNLAHRGGLSGMDRRILTEMIDERETEIWEKIKKTKLTIDDNTDRFSGAVGKIKNGSQTSNKIPVVPNSEILPSPKGKEAYIFYTDYMSDGTEADFTKQAEYQKKRLERKGYTVNMICTNEVEDFQDAWAGMSDAVDTAIIISHCNGMSLIFGDEEDRDNAISANGMNISGDEIPAIADLLPKDVRKLYLLACNSGHKELLSEMGTNVGDAFRDLGSIGTVYAYDGSVGFGFPSLEDELGYWPRLAKDQSSFYNMHKTFEYDDTNINLIPTGRITYR